MHWCGAGMAVHMRSTEIADVTTDKEMRDAFKAFLDDGPRVHSGNTNRLLPIGTIFIFSFAICAAGILWLVYDFTA
jgi:hypothetical protein